MKCLSVQQPFAQLILQGFKTMETRKWSTDYRGPLLIHATKGITQLTLVSKIKANVENLLGRLIMDLPRGVILGTVELVNCFPYRHDYYIGRRERTFGYFGPNEYIWKLANPQIFDEPIPASGTLGLWDYPDENLKLSQPVLS